METVCNHCKEIFDIKRAIFVFDNVAGETCFINVYCSKKCYETAHS